jgi:Cu2+-exporting ATPase
MMQSAMPVAVVGDGINDTPIIARADVGITLGMASAHAKLNADIVLLSQGLGTLAHLHRTARRLSAITRQNLHWALAYNVIALPLALAGVFAPWVAALLMAASSVAVVANASRLYEGPR